MAEKVVDSSEDVRYRDQWSALMLKQGTYTPGQLDTTWTEEIEADYNRWVEQQK